MTRVQRVLVMSMWLAVACGKGGGSSTSTGSASGSSSGASPAGALTGTWSGAWKRAAPAPAGGGDLLLTTGATTRFKRGGTMCPPEETPATVTVAGDKVTIEVSEPDVKSTYTGTRAGNELSGDLTTTCKLNGVLTTGTGTWTMTLQ